MSRSDQRRADPPEDSRTDRLAGVDSPSQLEPAKPLIRRRARASADRTRSMGWLVLLAVALLVLTVGFAGARSYQDLRRARDRAAVLNEMIESERAAVAGLGERIERLQEDPSSIERAIRSELGMVSDDQIVLVLPPELVD